MTEADATPTEATGRIPQHWLVFSVAAIAVFMMSLDSTLIPIALGDIGEGVGETAPSKLSWLVTTYAIAMASSVVAVGRIGDRTGRRRTFLIGLSLFVFGSALGAASTELWMLIGARAVQGTGAAFVFPSSLGLILAAWPPGQTTRVIASWTAVGAVAGAVGPTVGAALVQGPGWRWAFGIHVFFGIPALIRGRKVLVDTERRSETAPPDPIGVILVAITLGATALVLAQGRTWGWLDSRILLGAALIVTAGPVFLHRNAHHPAPVIEPAMLRLPTYRVAMAMSVLLSGGIFANFVMLPQFLGDVWGYSTFGVGLAIAPFSVAATITALASGRWSRRIDERYLTTGGVATVLASVIWLWVFADTSPNYWVELFPAIVMAGAGGWGLALTMLNSIGARDLDDSNYGVGVAILLTARQVGALAGVATAFGLLGEVALEPVDLLDRLHEVWLFVGVVLAATLAVSFLIPRRDATPLDVSPDDDEPVASGR